MPSRITSDILKTANSFKDDDARMQYIRENATIAVKEMININFNPNVKFLLPEGSPDLNFVKRVNLDQRITIFPIILLVMMAQL